MSITTEKEKLATERFLLVRLNPARYILPVLNAGLYEITLPFIINRLERNGVALTQVFSAPTNDDEWFQDEDTKLLQVQLASPPSDTLNVLVCYYYLYYTGTIFRPIGEDPENPDVKIREWLPLIQNYPSIFQSIDNIFSGVFTINDTDIVLINENKQFQNFLTDDDSFFNKDIVIWLCISDVTNIQKIFKGVIQKVVSSQNTVTLSCVDVFNKFKSKASMGDSTDETYYSLTGFPDVHDRDKDKAIPYIVGKYSRWTDYYFDLQSPTAQPGYRFYQGNQATCINFDVNIANNVNRDWGACRQKGQVAIQSFGTIDDAVSVGADSYLKLSSYANVQIGDTIRYQNGGGDEYGMVSHVGPFIYSGNPYNLAVYSLGTNLILSTSLTPLPSFAVTFDDPVTLNFPYLLYDYDYTIDDSTVTSGGNRFVKIIFKVNFESHFAIGTLDPNRHRIFYRTSNDAPQKHGEFIQEVCDIVGIPTNAASITAADAALDVYCQFAIPYFDESDFDSYLKYVQDLLSSTLGFLKINADFELEYNLLESPVSTDIRDSFLMLADSTFASVEYQDIVTELIAYNPHNSATKATEVIPSPSETRTKNKSKFLHGISNVVRFRHLLETITDRIDQLAGVKSERYVKYKFATATQDIDSEINTDVQLENGVILGTTKVKDVKIISIDKSPKLTTIEATDLKGL